MTGNCVDDDKQRECGRSDGKFAIHGCAGSYSNSLKAQKLTGQVGRGSRRAAVIKKLRAQQELRPPNSSTDGLLRETLLNRHWCLSRPNPRIEHKHHSHVFVFEVVAVEDERPLERAELHEKFNLRTRPERRGVTLERSFRRRGQRQNADEFRRRR